MKTSGKGASFPSRGKPSEPDFRTLFESAPGLYLVVEPDAPRYTVVAASDLYLRATMRKREEILGRGLFEVWPPNPAEPESTGVDNTAASLERVIRNRAPDTMAVQRHDVRQPEQEGGAVEKRFWSPVNSPVFGRDGELLYILHRVQDVTESVRLRNASRDAVTLEEQVFDNLVGNAMKFSRERITVGAAPKDDEVLFWVGDDGTGISAENLPHLFDRFWQATKSDRRGVGLGLWIVKESSLPTVDASGSKARWASERPSISACQRHRAGRRRNRHGRC